MCWGVYYQLVYIYSCNFQSCSNQTSIPLLKDQNKYSIRNIFLRFVKVWMKQLCGLWMRWWHKSFFCESMCHIVAWYCHGENVVFEHSLFANKVFFHDDSLNFPKKLKSNVKLHYVEYAIGSNHILHTYLNTYTQD